MKRLFLILLPLLSIALSCKKDSLSENDDRGANLPITVSPSAVSLSQTRNSNLIYDYEGLVNAVQAGKHIGLFSYAHFDGDSTHVSIMDNAEMSYNGTNWFYNPMQYWLPSATDYSFFSVYPYAQSRLSPSFVYPSSSDSYMMQLQPGVYPMYETWSGEDYAQGNIIYKYTKNLYYSNPAEDIMFGQVDVDKSQFGNEVEVPLTHACCAVRFSVRNLSPNPLTLTNWYLTGLKNHTDMVIYIIGCEEENDPLRFMTIVPDQYIKELKITHFGQSSAKDSVKVTIDGETTDWIVCADGNALPGSEYYYKYVMLSSRLKQVGASYNLSHTHSDDGKTITFYDGSGKSWTDAHTFAKESEVYKNAIATIQSTLYAFPNYKANIFWGPAHHMDVDNFFIPLLYKRGAEIMDVSFNQVRGDDDDYDLMIHQFECRSHMFQSDGIWKANGGIYLPINSDNYAYLYSPYFMNAETHKALGADEGDWKEGMGDVSTTPYTPKRWNDTDPNYNVNEDGKQRSVFLWTADNGNPVSPVLVDTCITNMNAQNGHYTPSVGGGDLTTTLNDWGYLIFYAQTLDHLKFHFFTSADGSGTGNPTTATYNAAPTYHEFSIKDYTPQGEWLSGYTYDYIITISGDEINMKLNVEPWNEREINLD